MTRRNLTSLDEHYRMVDESLAESLKGIKEAVKQINDTNILHVKNLDNNTQAIIAMSKAILDIKEYWGTIVKWLIIALIVLAGGEKVVKLLGL